LKAMKKTYLGIFLVGILLVGAVGVGAATPDNVKITFDLQRIAIKASNQYAAWIEDGNGRYVATIAATEFTARKGYIKRPESLSDWIKVSNWANSSEEVVDAVSMATPGTGPVVLEWDGKDSSGKIVPPGTYTYKLEGTIFWDKRVVWSGKITTGDKPSSSVATAEYYPSKDTATEKGLLITNVKASYR